MKRRNYSGFLIPILLLAVWHLAGILSMVPAYILPSPSKIFLIGWDFIAGDMEISPYSGTFYLHAAASIQRVFRGFILAVFFGVILGYISGRNEKFNNLVEPFLNGVKAVPGIGWLPVALVWFGVGQKTTIFLISLASFFPIYINVCGGAKKVPDIYIKSARMMGASSRRIFFTVIVPASIDSVITGLRLALGISWAYLVLGELTGVTFGLGAVMMDARMLGHIDVVITSMVIIAVMGWLSDILLTGIFKMFSSIRGRHYA